MADPRFGTTGGNYENLVREAEAAKTAEYTRRAEERRSVEEDVAAAEEQAGRVRGGLRETTQELSSALRANTSALEAETVALEASNRALSANLALRTRLAGAPGGRGGSLAAEAAAPMMGVGSLAVDPQASARLAAAQMGLAEAELARTRAQSAVATARRSPTTTPEELAPLVAARETSSQLVATQRQRVAQEQHAVQANEQIEAELARQRAAETATAAAAEANAALQREEAGLRGGLLATLRSRLAQMQAAEATASLTGGPLALSAGRGGPLLLTSGSLAEGPPRPPGEPLALASGPERLQLPMRAGWAPPMTTTDDPLARRSSTALPADEGAAERVRAYRASIAQTGRTLDEFSMSQVESARAVNLAAANYASASTALTRHGALTTEFIQAFARGQVTVGEFGSQVVSTIGKFGGWAVAAASVYGVFKAFEQVRRGAEDTQGAIQNLGRFIPGLGGPAGGGKSQVGAAGDSLRNISTEFNLPIEEVSTAMQVMARVFHNVADAGDATRAVLAAVKLDQVPQAQAEQYLIGIGQSMNIQSGAGLMGVMNSLNQLQAGFGARVQQTLPALARAVPMAAATGTSLPQLEALTALGVLSGQTGNQVGTGLIRSMGRFAWTSGSMMEWRRLGLNPQYGNYGDLTTKLSGLIGKGGVSNDEIRNIAVALGGQQFGTRTFMPMLERMRRDPGEYDRLLHAAQHPRSFEEDLGAATSTVAERFKAIGIALQNFGSQIASTGLLQPIIALANGIGGVVHGMEALLQPLSAVTSVLGALPGWARTVLETGTAFVAARAFINRTTLGGAAQSYVGRMPGLEALRNQPREAIEGTITRLQTYERPELERDMEAANRRSVRAQLTRDSAQQEYDRFLAANAGLGYKGRPFQPETQAGAQYAAEAGERGAALKGATSQAAEAMAVAAKASERLAAIDADIALLSNKRYSWAQRTAYMEEMGFSLTEETVDVQKRTLAERTRIMETLGTVAATEGGGATAGVAAATGAAAGRRTPPPAAGEGGAAPVEAAGLGAVTAMALTRAASTETPAAETLTARYRRATDELSGAATGARQAFARLTTSVTAQRDAFSEMGAMGYMRERVGGRVAEFGSATNRFLGSSMAPMAGMIAMSLLGGAVGGTAGGYLSSVGGSGFMGMMAAQMMGGGRAWAGPAGFVAGTALGQVQQGGASTALMGGAGALIGGALGFLSGGGPAGAWVGAMAGQFVGGLAGNLLFGKHDQADVSKRAAADWNQQVTQLTRPNEDDLNAIFHGSGGTRNTAAQKVSAQIQQYQSVIQLFGRNTRQGVVALQSLNETINDALAQAEIDPATAAQLLQSATAPRLKAAQDAFQYQLTQGTGVDSGQRAAADANSVLQASVTDTWGHQADEAAKDLAAAKDALARAYAGHGGTVKQAVKSFNAAWLHNQAMQGALRTAQESSSLAQQQNAAAGYQADMATVQSQAGLAQAQAGGDVMAQLRAQRDAATRAFNKAWSNRQLTPHDRENAMRDAHAGQIAADNRITQQGLTELQAQGSSFAAQAPIGRPDIEATRTWHSLQAQWKYVQANKSAFDPSQVAALAGQVAQAEKAATEAVADYAIQLQDIKTAIQQAKDYGDAVAQAADAVAGATADLATAKKTHDPLKIAEANRKLLDATNAQHQTDMQRAQQIGENQAAQVQGDPLAVARVNLHTAQQAVKNAKGVDEQRQANTGLLNAQYAYNQAVTQRIQLQGEVAQAQAAGFPVEQAQIALRTAQREVANAHGFEAQAAAARDLANAQYQMAQSLEDHYIALGDLAASQEVEPLAKLSDQIRGTARALAHTKPGSDPAIKLQTQLNSLKQQKQQTLIDQREADTQFNLEMMNISADQAMQQLQSLLHLQGLTKAKRQSILEEIRRISLGDYSTIGGGPGSFDLMPGNIPLPTPLDIRRALHRGIGMPGGRGLPQHMAIGSASASTQINVYVRSSNDVPQVVDAIERSTSSHLRGRMRAAGVRGI